MRYYCILTLCAALSLVACKHPHRDKIVGSFPINERPMWEAVPNFEGHIGLFGIKPAGEYVVCNKLRQSHFFGIFDSAGSFIADLCRRGNGPNEFLAPAYFGQYETEQGDIMIWILERGARRSFMKVNLSESIVQGQTVIEKTYDLSGYDELQPRNIFYVSDELLFGTNDDEFCMTFTLNPKSSEIRYNAHLLDFPLHSPDTRYTSQSMATIKPDKTLIATSFFYMPQIDIYSSSGGRINTIFYKTVVEPESLESTRLIDYHDQIFSTDEYIYALYREHKGEDAYDSYIQIFDWAGVPTASLEIDYASDFYVDRQNRHLVTVDFSTETDVVRVYDLSSLNLCR